MLRTILVALDDSPYSDTATTLALQWASRYDARLIGVAILDTPSIIKREFVPMGTSAFKKERDDARLTDAQQHAMDFLSRFAQRCSEAGVRSETFEEVGDAGWCILRQAHQCDVVILGRETHFHFETQERPDSTLNQILRNSPRPIVTVPRQLSEGNGLVMAYGEGGQVGRTLQTVQLLGLTNGETVHLVSIRADGSKGDAYTDFAARFLESHATPYELHRFESKKVEPADLLEKVRSLTPRLLVMGAEDHQPLRSFFATSFTRAMLRNCPAPVLIGG